MRHKLDIYPIPKEKAPMFINEPWLIDKTLLEYFADEEQLDKEADNVGFIFRWILIEVRFSDDWMR
ncbi:hypothetical protein MASR2M70_03320 [Bacillota bacterium]